MRPAKTQISLGIRPVWLVLAYRIKKPWVLHYPLSIQRRLWYDWADAQAGLGLRWAHSSFVVFVVPWLIFMLRQKVQVGKTDSVIGAKWPAKRFGDETTQGEQESGRTDPLSLFTNCRLFSAFLTGCMCALGITAGAHRLWAHKSYKAKLPFRILLAILNCMAAEVRVLKRAPKSSWFMQHSLGEIYKL